MNIANEIEIIILNCNGLGYIEECIKSIKENTEEPYKIIVVDQNSKDGSKEWLLDNKIDHLILNTKTKGFADGRNLAIRTSKCDWFALLDSETIIKDKFWLDKLWNYTLGKRIGFIEGRVYNKIDGKQEFIKMGFCLIRKQCFNEIGYFDKKFFTGGDDDWLIRLENSWWLSVFCSDTNVLWYGGESIIKVFGKERWEVFQSERDNLLTERYTDSFLNRTLFINEEKRLKAEEKLFI